MAAVDNSTVTVAGDVCWHFRPGGYVVPTYCVTDVDPWPGGVTGHAVVVLSGPGKGQHRRVVGVGGPRNRTVVLDRPFDPPPTPASTVQIGPYRGQIMLVGNLFQKGGNVQLYAACYDCTVAQNVFAQFGFTSWGRNPHGAGFQPNLANFIEDNVVTGAIGVRGCSATCSAPFGARCFRPSTDGCSNNGTSDAGRDCAAYDNQPYEGAINLRLVWRRNAMQGLDFFGGDLPGIPASWHGGTGRIPLVDGGLIEHTVWATPNGSSALNLSAADNVLLRD